MTAKEFFKALLKPVTNNRLYQRQKQDPAFRNTLSLILSISLTLVFVVIETVAGFLYHSFWFFSLAIYYALLTLLRLFLLLPLSKTRNAEDAARRKARFTALLLFLLNLALGGIVFFMVAFSRGFSYHEIFIYAKAAYTFYAVISTVVFLFRQKRQKDLVTLSLKTVKLTAALVSLLALETAMITAFGDGDPLFYQTMTALTGGGIALTTVTAALLLFKYSRKAQTKDTP